MNYPTVKTYIPKVYTEYFMQYLNEHKQNYDIFGYEYDIEILQMYGLTDTSMIWARREAASTYGGGKSDKDFSNYIEKVLNLLKIDYTDYQVYIKTCYLPVDIHVDAEAPNKQAQGQVKTPPQHEQSDGSSIIIPLTFNKNIHTIVFKNTVLNNDYLREFKNTLTNQPIYKHNLDYSQYNNIWNKDQMMKTGEQLLDHVELEEIFVWEENIAFGFDKRRMHSGNDFTKFGIASKDFVLVHCH